MSAWLQAVPSASKARGALKALGRDGDTKIGLSVVRLGPPQSSSETAATREGARRTVDGECDTDGAFGEEQQQLVEMIQRASEILAEYPSRTRSDEGSSARKISDARQRLGEVAAAFLSTQGGAEGRGGMG